MTSAHHHTSTNTAPPKTVSHPLNGIPGSTGPHATEIAPGLFAPVPQHLFCARLDVAIDGDGTSIAEVDAVGIPIGPEGRGAGCLLRPRTVSSYAHFRGSSMRRV